MDTILKNNMNEPTMTLGLFMKGFTFGVVSWIPFMMFAFIVPLIGWVLIPVAVTWPIGAPFAMLSKKKKEWRKQYEK